MKHPGMGKSLRKFQTSRVQHFTRKNNNKREKKTFPVLTVEVAKEEKSAHSLRKGTLFFSLVVVKALKCTMTGAAVLVYLLCLS